MGYFPGSYRLHLLGRPEFVEIPVGGTEDDSNSAELRGTGPIHLDMQRGPVGGCHHSLIFHLARPDTLSRTRRVHTAIFFRTGSTRGANAGHFAVDRANVKLGKPHGQRRHSTRVAAPGVRCATAAHGRHDLEA